MTAFEQPMESNTSLEGTTQTKPVVFGEGKKTVEDINAVADGSRSAQLSECPEFKEKIRKGSEFLDRLLAEDGVIYGVTTGYGDSPAPALFPRNW